MEFSINGLQYLYLFSSKCVCGLWLEGGRNKNGWETNEDKGKEGKDKKERKGRGRGRTRETGIDFWRDLDRVIRIGIDAPESYTLGGCVM